MMKKFRVLLVVLFIFSKVDANQKEKVRKIHEKVKENNGLLKDIRYLFEAKGLPKPPKKYCQPGDPCWPTDDEIKAFADSLYEDHNNNKTSCLGLDRFVSFHDPAAYVPICLPYTGLTARNSTGCAEERESTGIYQSPDPNCDPNPFVTGAYYKEPGIACMTPYQFLNNRNHRFEWMAAFIVTAETKEDIQKSIIFAKNHNIGISVMNTGHKMQDRNAGTGPFTLQIRTTCFRGWEVVNDQIQDAQGTTWTQGYAIVGAGLSFGENFWTQVENAKGVYELAYEANKEMVGGTCHSVGITGWTIGGGRGWTAPKYGLGVDQLLEADLVAADGTFMTACPTQNKDLFYAIRGGGHGFGVIHSLKIKLHNPSCYNLFDGRLSMSNCYHYHVAQWEGPYDGTTTPEYVKEIIRVYVKWSNLHRNEWNSLFQLKYNSTSNQYTIFLSANHFGNAVTASFTSFGTEFNAASLMQDRVYYNAEEGEPNPDCTSASSSCFSIWKTVKSKYWCENNPENVRSGECFTYPWSLERWRKSVRFMVGKEIQDEDNKFIDDLVDTWQPLCDKFPYSACASGYQIHGDLPAINPTTQEGVYASPSPVKWRTAAFQVFNFGVNSDIVKLTYDQEIEWMHYTLAPILYKYSDSSYFNEAEYTLNPGQWERRFWGEENHCKLKNSKYIYDPDQVFGCRLCIGAEVGYQSKPCI